jgi:hypothetical protein
MRTDFGSRNENEDLDRNAYNAAFYELGLRWHWDSETYGELLARGGSRAEGIHHYLQTRQPHLLKAYDAPFLIQVIEEKKAQHVQRSSAAAHGCRPFDWAETAGGEIGA